MKEQELMGENTICISELGDGLLKVQVTKVMNQIDFQNLSKSTNLQAINSATKKKNQENTCK